MIIDPLSIADAVGSESSGVIAVTGYVVIVDDSARLCDALAESYPPQCGGDSIDITNPDATRGLVLLEEGTTQWSPEPVILLGEVTSAGFAIDVTSI